MKNLKNNKVIAMLVIVLTIILGLTVSSFADDNIQVINPSDVIGGGSSSSANTNANTNANVNTNANKINNVTTNTSSYNNTNLPSTGLEDHTALFVVIGTLAIIGVIAFKKVNDYKDI